MVPEKPWSRLHLLTYWSKTFHISGFPIPSLLTMLSGLRPKNSKSSAKREVLSTWRELHTIHQPIEQLSVQCRLSNQLDGNLHNFQRKPCWTFCISTGAHRQIVDSLLASYLMVDQYAQNWMQYYPHLLTSCKASRLEQFLQMMIRVIQSTTSKQVILATHSTLVLNKPKIRDGFQPWSLNELALVQFTVPQGSIWRRHIDQLRPRYFSTEDDEPGEDYTFDTDKIKYLRTLYHIHLFKLWFGPPQSEIELQLCFGSQKS